MNKNTMGKKLALKKINELYVSKKVLLFVQYRKKTVEIPYFITEVFGTEMKLTFKLRSIIYPCKIPKMENIEIGLNNEFPDKKLIKKIKSTTTK